MLTKKKQETIRDEEDGIQKYTRRILSSPIPRPWNESEKNVPRRKEEEKEAVYIYVAYNEVNEVKFEGT